MEEPLVAESAGARGVFMAIVAICLAVIYAPSLYLVLASFNPSLQLGLVAPQDFSLKWYAALADDRRLGAALEELLLIALVTSLVATPVGLSAALAFREMRRARGIWFLVMLFWMFVPGTIQGLGLSVIFKLLDVKPFWGTVVAGHVLWALPFAFTVSVVSLSAVRQSTIDAARDLGASWLRALRDITVPLIRGGLVASFVFAFLLSLNEFARAYYLVGRQNTLPLYMFGAMNSGASPTIYALAGAIIIISVSILLAGARMRR